MKSASFSFDHVCILPDEQIGRHNQGTWELSLLIIGSGERCISNNRQPMREGEVVLIPPGIEHQWLFDNQRTDAEGRIENISLTFHPTLLDAVQNTFPEASEKIEKVKGLSEAVVYGPAAEEKITELLLAMSGASNVERVPMMMELLLQLATVDDCHILPGSSRLTPGQRKLEKLRIYCRCNYGEPILLEDAARHLGMNKSAFCRFVKRETSLTFTRYLNDIRLEHAVELLEHTDLPITQIAYQSGYANATHFNRLFKVRFGITPTAHRAHRS